MNVLFVYPKYPDTFWSFKYVMKFVSKKAAFPPLGLLTVAAMVPEEWNKRLIDLNVQPLTDKAIGWADMVFISAMMVQKESVNEIINRCRAKGRTIVAGGPYFTTGYENVKGVDHFVLNEAEVTLPMFLSDLENGKLKKIYTSKERPDITKTPLPLWSLIKFKDYATIGVQYSRGCPYNCEFCDIIIMNGRIPRTKSPRQMMTEMDALYSAGWRGSVFVVDDNFIGNTSDVKKMLLELIRWQHKRKYPFKFLTEASTNLAEDEELMKMMSAANFHKVFVGIETPNVESLKECNKYQNMKMDLAESVRKIQQHGMQVMGGFIVGFDNDTETVFEAQIKFIQQVGIVTAMVGMLTAAPQTRLWERLKKENRLLKEMSGENTDGNLNFIPKMGKKELVEGYKRLVSTLYSRKEYYKRIRIFIKNYQPTVRNRLTSGDIRALFMSIIKIGFASKAWNRYWALLFRTTFTKPRAVPIAIELAILGFHFEKVARNVAAC